MPSYFEGFEEFKRAMSNIDKKLISRTRIAAEQIAAAIEREAKKNASTYKWSATYKGPHKSGTGPGPNVRTQRLRDGIKYVGAPAGLGGYAVEVGSTMIYSRQVELGGGKWKPGTKYPFFWPAVEKVKADGTVARIQKNIFK